MTDLLTRLELEDAIKHHKRIFARVAEVALVWANITSEIDSGEARKWNLERFYLYKAGGSGEVMVDARVVIDYEDRPVTKKFGAPENDDEEDYSLPENLTRRIAFPMEWLMTEDWRELAEKRARAVAQSRRDLKINNLKEQIGFKERDIERLRGELEKAQQEKP